MIGNLANTLHPATTKETKFGQIGDAFCSKQSEELSVPYGLKSDLVTSVNASYKTDD
jgi:hypothetical protein